MNTSFRFALILGTFFISISSASVIEAMEDNTTSISPITRAAGTLSVVSITLLSFPVTWKTLGKKLQDKIAPQSQGDEMSKVRKALGWTARLVLSVGVTIVTFFITMTVWNKIKKSLAEPEGSF